VPHVARNPALRVGPLVAVSGLPGGRNADGIGVEGELAVGGVVEQLLVVTAELALLVRAEAVVPDNRVPPAEAQGVEPDLQVPGPLVGDLHEQAPGGGQHPCYGGQPAVGEVEVGGPLPAVVVAGVAQADVERRVGDDQVGDAGGKRRQHVEAVAGEDGVGVHPGSLAPRSMGRKTFFRPPGITAAAAALALLALAEAVWHHSSSPPHWSAR
jgi:hypothetical protein